MPVSYTHLDVYKRQFSDLSFNDYNQCCANQAYNDVAVAIEKIQGA